MQSRLFCAAFAAAIAASAFATDCLEDGGVFRSSLNCTGLPTIPKFFEVSTFSWGGIGYLALNTGNDLSLFQLTDVLHPRPDTASHFGVGNQGDSDYDLRSFSICDDCRLGIATFKRGNLLFDLGTGVSPRFVAKRFYLGSDPIGGLTFEYGEGQYLIATQLPGDCGGDATLYRFNGVTDVQQIGCVDVPGAPGKFFGGVEVEGAGGAFLYLGFQDGKVYIHEVQPVGGGLIALSYTGNDRLRASLGVSRGLAVDEAADLAVTATNIDGMRIYDISNPANPTLRSARDLDVRTAAIRFPFVWVSPYLGSDASMTYDIEDPASPVEMDPSFWDPLHPWNSHSPECEFDAGAVFSDDASALYVARYAVAQVIDFSGCPPPEPPLFVDGFDSGTTGAWSAVVPGP